MIETQFIAFFIILLVAVFFSTVSGRLHLPWSVALIIGGIIAGPNLLGWIEINDTISFMAEIGAVFLMFMAGLETPLSSFQKSAYKVSFLAFINGFIPLLVGFGIGILLGFDLIIAILMGIIFVSSSVAVVVPTLDRKKMLNSQLGHVIIGSTIIQDVASLVLISIFLQVNDPVTSLPLWLFYFVVGIIIFLLYKIIRWIRKWVITKGSFHQELQFILLILTGVVVLFSLLGLHHIIAGFFAGFVLSESLSNNKIKGSLHTVGYGVFIPFFFVLTGSNTDFSVFGNLSGAAIITSLLIVGLISSKFISGYLTARYESFSKNDSLLIAVTSIPQLATTLAVVYTAFNQGIIGVQLVTAFVILSIVTTVLAPLLTQIILKYREADHFNTVDNEKA